MKFATEPVHREINTLVTKLREDGGNAHRKVYTIGTFDLMHRGHEQLLKSLRMFGDYVVVAIHDDESYFKLKKKWPMDTIKLRMEKVKRYADMVFVIPDTDPTTWMQMMISQADIENKSCCYVRGDDMPNFPAREWVEANMDVFLTPRMPSISSSEIRSHIPGAKDYVPTDKLPVISDSEEDGKSDFESDSEMSMTPTVGMTPSASVDVLPALAEAVAC